MSFVNYSIFLAALNAEFGELNSLDILRDSLYGLSTLFLPQITAISNGELGILEETIGKIPNEFFASNPSVNEKRFKNFCIKYFAKNLKNMV